MNKRFSDEEINSLLELETKATPLWGLDHNDMYVAAEVPSDKTDWYWISGSMERSCNGYDAEQSDEDMRGPKEVVQNNCRLMVASRNNLRALIEEVIEQRAHIAELEKRCDSLSEALNRVRKWIRPQYESDFSPGHKEFIVNVVTEAQLKIN